MCTKAPWPRCDMHVCCQRISLLFIFQWNLATQKRFVRNGRHGDAGHVSLLWILLTVSFWNRCWLTSRRFSPAGRRTKQLQSSFHILCPPKESIKLFICKLLNYCVVNCLPPRVLLLQKFLIKFHRNIPGSMISTIIIIIPCNFLTGASFGDIKYLC